MRGVKTPTNHSKPKAAFHDGSAPEAKQRTPTEFICPLDRPKQTADASIFGLRFASGNSDAKHSLHQRLAVRIEEGNHLA